ncbi:fibrous sheath CABYR-binding protein isoform X2 [Archocentrus centrarchus]|uniref:fibrous sheath CABYR-binding protein isoform X2 n=1 Tax=Archocentrus centrarchus TaxID=63155 RepID=UPI0011E9C35C|nr:fibrous sheath CABYR-binding protein-like isoform X2 [Archocentrus centrarchus]
MFCRRAWQRVGPLARRAFKPAPRYTPVRHMAFGVPGGSTNMTYFVLCGGGLTAAFVYAYKTVNGDTERYEERLANMGSTAKAPSETAAPEAAPPAAEPAPVEEEAPAAEVAAESAPATAEPVAETSAEPVAEAASEEAEAAAVSEVVVTEAAAESADTEEAAPPAEAQVVLEAAVEAPAEALVAESTESVPDLFAAVKILASSTTDIAAASVGENSLVEAVRQIEGEGKGHEVLEAEALEALAKEASEGAAVVEGEEELKSEEDEEGAGAEDAQIPAAEEVVRAGEEEAAVGSHPQETTSSTPTVDEPEAEDAAPEEAISPEDAAPAEDAISSEDAAPAEDAISSEDAAPAEEATSTAEAAPVDESSPDEIAPAGEAAAETSAEETVEAAVGTTQLAAASVGADLEVLSPADAKLTSGSPLHAEKPCHSCHAAPSAGEEVAPPAAVGEELVTDGGVDTSHEAKEAGSAQTMEATVVVTVQS